VISLDLAALGWSGKEFRVLEWTLGEGGPELVLQEDSAASYDWAGGEASLVDAAPDTTLPDAWAVGVPGAPAVTETLYASQTGAGVKTRATVAWGAPADALVESYRLEYRAVGASVWTPGGETRGTTLDLNDLGAGSYEFRVQAVNWVGAEGAWSATTTKELIGLTARPASLTGFYLTALNGQAHLRWDRATDLDVLIGGHIRVRHSPLTSGVTWAGSVDLGPLLSGSASEASVPLLTGTYLVKAVDSGGNVSLDAVSATTTLPDIVAMNVVSTLTQSPGFAGAKSGTEVAGGVLRLTANYSLIDSWGLVDDIADWDTEGFTGVTLAGTYEFDASLDLGAVYVSRVTADLRALVASVTDLIDSRTSLIDAWDSFDGESVEALANAQLEIATTNDDPAGAPTWSGWMPFTIGDYVCRAFKFRLSLATSDATVNISISTLAVTVDMPDRVEAGSLTTGTGADTTIAYVNGFKAAPYLGLTIRNMAAGDVTEVVSVGAAAAAVNIRNGGARVARDLDWMAKGYGRAA
jgi:hypothetical protein